MNNLDGSIYNALVAAKLAGASGGGGGNIASNNVTAMTGYEEAETASAIETTDSLNQAVGKLEKGVDVNKTNILSITPALVECVDNGAKNLAPLNAATTENTGYFGTTAINLPAGKYKVSFKLTTTSTFGFAITIDGAETAKFLQSPPYSDTLITYDFTASTGITQYRFYANNSASISEFMICKESEYNVSPTYQPYAMNNVDLTSNMLATYSRNQVSATTANTYEYTGLSVTCPANQLIEIWVVVENGGANPLGIIVNDSSSNVTAQGSIIAESADTISGGGTALWARELHCIPPRKRDTAKTFYIWVKCESTGDNYIQVITRPIVT